MKVQVLSSAPRFEFILKHHIIYVPGIGDNRAMGQDYGIYSWRLWGVRGHYHPVGWADGEAFAPKLERLLGEIDDYLAAGDTVSLLGFSAGASVVLNAFAERRTQLAAVVCISGKINHPKSAHNYFGRNPAFGESLQLLQTSLVTFSAADKAKLLTLNPIKDDVVSYQDAVITGVKQWRIAAVSHVMAIAVSLTFCAPFIVLHIRQTARKRT